MGNTVTRSGDQVGCTTVSGKERDLEAKKDVLDRQNQEYRLYSGQEEE